MPISTHARRELAVNVIVFSGVVNADDLDILVGFYGANRGEAARRDEILLFTAGVDLSALTADHLADLKAQLAVIISAAHLPMIVRTALVCHEPACLPVLEAWAALSTAGGDDLLTQTHVTHDLGEAAAWLALSDAELGRLEELFSERHAAA